MIVSFHSNSTVANVGSGTTVTMTLPAILPGDVLMACIAGRGTNFFTTNNTPTTWTTIANSATGNTSVTNTSGSASLFAAYCVYDGFNTPNNVFTASATITVANYSMLVLRGINPASPFGNSSITRSTAATVTPNTTGITIGSNAFCVMVLAGGCDHTFSGQAAAGGNPASWSEKFDVLTTTGGDTTLCVATGSGNTLGGATGVLSATGTNSTMNAIGVFEFKPYIRSRQRYNCGS